MRTCPECRMLYVIDKRANVFSHGFFPGPEQLSESEEAKFKTVYGLIRDKVCVRCWEHISYADPNST